jgi:hypothetical protein
MSEGQTFNSIEDKIVLSSAALLIPSSILSLFLTLLLSFNILVAFKETSIPAPFTAISVKASHL